MENVERFYRKPLYSTAVKNTPFGTGKKHNSGSRGFLLVNWKVAASWNPRKKTTTRFFHGCLDSETAIFVIWNHPSGTTI